jgi:hypothetical protein
MYPRLYIAKQLLKDDGVIFISIDDSEVTQLRMLLDEVFGEENFKSMKNWDIVLFFLFLMGHMVDGVGDIQRKTKSV